MPKGGQRGRAIGTNSLNTSYISLFCVMSGHDLKVIYDKQCSLLGICMLILDMFIYGHHSD